MNKLCPYQLDAYASMRKVTSKDKRVTYYIDFSSSITMHQPQRGLRLNGGGNESKTRNTPLTIALLRRGVSLHYRIFHDGKEVYDVEIDENNI